jgi:hypothetical protein
MRRSKYRRASRNSNWFSGRRRIVAVVATLVAFGAIVTVTQVSNASTNRTQKKALAACDQIARPPKAKLSTQTRKGTWTTDNGTVTQHADDGAGDTVTAAQLRDRCRQWVMDNVGNQQGTGGQGGAGDVKTTAPTTASATADPSASSADPSASGDGSADPSGSASGSASASASASASESTETAAPPTEATTAAPAPSDTSGSTAPPPGAGLGILTNSCATSTLEKHDGFQNGNRCVSTEFGEVGLEANNPSLLITEAPRSVAANTPFTLKVSTRNLIRDRFLAAGKGGYYVESSVLKDGLVRGHFHTACRMLANTNEAPAPEPVPAFFVATEDSQGGATPDTVTIQVPGLPTAGTAQCASWAGDGSHRIPMMTRANETPAFDAVRIRVR